MRTQARNIQDTYPLSPMQAGLLFHSLYAPDSGVYVTQVTCTLHNLDVATLEHAWQQVIDRHPILRTAFVWKNTDQPLQVVGRHVSLPLHQEDWRTLAADEQQARFHAYLEHDRNQGFDFARPPLMRLALFRLDEQRYKLVWSHHHILLDGWSLRILLREAFVIYEALRRGDQPDLPPLRPYRDYIAWLQHQDAAEAERFWRRSLAGFVAPTPLGIDGNSVGNNTGNGKTGYAEARLEISPETTAALQTLTRAHALTLNTLVQGALGLLISRYSSEEDVVFGSVVSGRPPNLPGVEAMVGLFVNTLPARLHTPPQMRLLDWLQQIQTQQVETRHFEYSPLVDVQQWSDLSRGAAMFEILYAFENYPGESALNEATPSVDVRDFHVFEKVSYPITILVGPGETINVKVLYEQGRYTAPAIERMMGHLAALLERFAADPQGRLRYYTLLTEDERRLLVESWNDNRLDFPRDACLHQLFEAQAARTPDATALVFGEERFTYAQLNRYANQMAHHLRQLGVGPEVLVGVCLARSPRLLITMLGILKAGGAYVPLDPAYPQERLAFILEDAQAPVLVTEQALADLVAAAPTGCTVVDLDRDWGAIAAADDTNLTVLTGGDNLAYVIYTSGSTGRPKGVAIEHRNAGALIHWAQTVYSADELAGVLASTSICFDLSVYELFFTLSVGGKVILAENALALPSLPAADEVTLINTVPSAIAELVRMDGIPSSVTTVNLAGEPLQTRLVDQIYRQETIARVYDLYGPSEDTTYSTFTLRQAAKPATIGRPIANTQAYLLDADLNPTPVGVIGELYLGGEGVVRGYLARPDLTAEKFVPDPFSGRAGARLYRTGDLARYRPDGNLEFLGRKDYQVKIRGFRIELGEIEAALHRLPSLQDAVVVAREETPGEKRLVAYVVPKADPAPSAAALRAALQERLPDYMVPSLFVNLPALPLTPNGKVNRKALPAPERVHVTGDAPLAEPQTAVEELLVELWAQTLGLAHVSVNDHFFEVGGHSLLATRLISRIRDAFQVEMPLSRVFENPVLSDLAARIEEAQDRDAEPALPSLQRVPRDGDLPLSFAQQRLWFLDQWTPGDSTYNVPAAVRLHGRLDVDALNAVLAEIVRRHEILRTTFENVRGMPRQVIAPPQPMPIDVVDLTDQPAADREAALQQTAAQALAQPFDLAAGPLFRVKLVRLAEDDHALLLTMHHTIIDGWSLGILVDEVATLYTAFSQGKASPLPELPVQYADFAHWQRQWLQGEQMTAQLDYWRQQLDGAPALLELPTDRPRPAVQRFHGASRPLRLSKELTDALKALGRREGVTLFMTLLAAFQTLLHRYSGQDDVLVGTPVAGRTQSELEKLIGLFVNTLVLRSRFERNPTFRDLLRQVRKTALDAYAHQDLPFDQLVEALQPARALSHSPLFQVLFVLQNAPRPALDLPDLTLSAVEMRGRTAKFDLSLALTDTGDGLVGALEYNTDLFDAVTVDAMIGHFETLLSNVATNPRQRIGSIPMLSPAETRQLVVDQNRTAVEYEDTCLHTLVETQAARTPENVAVVMDGDDGAQLSYAELNARANQLAHHLRRLGIGPDRLVGLCMQRSLNLVVGMLAVMKAGGAYVPLDPSYPEKRLATMIEDSGINVILVQDGIEIEPPVDAKSNGSAHGYTFLNLDADWGEVAQSPTHNPDVDIAEDHTAYVIYTSGSTGKPKGVLVPHRAIVNHMRWLLDTFDFTPADSVLQKTPISFDASIWEFYAPLLCGGRLVMARPGGHLDGAYLSDAVTRHGVSVLQTVPALLGVLLDEPSFASCTSLRLLFCGGGVLTAEMRDRFHAQLPAQLINFYGPTETAIDVLAWVCRRQEMQPVVPIGGRPLANTQVYVLDGRGQLLPVGAPGELYVGGRQVSRGYLNRPALTAERFVPDPFSGRRDARLYRTGDLVRYRRSEDGLLLEFLGRVDQQVKLRGFRIELGEIEAVLRRHSAVQDAVVTALPTAQDERRLVAYLTSAGGAEQPSVTELRRFLLESLPDYMTPAVFVWLDTLPLLPNGKVDRNRLPAPDAARPTLETRYVAPATPEEETLAVLCAQLLGVEQVGVHDNFFDLGGHSLLATQFVARVHEALGVDLSLRELFETPTVAALAEIVAHRRLTGATADDRIESITRGEQDLAAILAELEQLSDEEASAMLAGEG